MIKFWHVNLDWLFFFVQYHSLKFSWLIIKLQHDFLFVLYEVIMVSWSETWILHVNMSWLELIQYIIISVFFKKIVLFFLVKLCFFFLDVQIALKFIKLTRSNQINLYLILFFFIKHINNTLYIFYFFKKITRDK